MWDPQQYLQFADERSRPFFDLLAHVPCQQPKSIADLGCGAGNLTEKLSERWPQARVTGIDNSPEMLTKAKRLAIPGRLEFAQAAIENWTPAEPIDLLLSNAALHWVSDHAALLVRLAGMLTPNGMLAVQMPARFNTPSQTAIEETAADPRWAATLQGVGLHRESVRPLTWYMDRLHDLGFAVNAWETTYVHVLTGPDPVLEWTKGTALRPLLKRLEPSAATEFLRELAGRFRAAYPPRGDVTLFPFPRLFFVATRPAR
jgi:trans-aconitate 2-methyltransferase